MRRCSSSTARAPGWSRGDSFNAARNKSSVVISIWNTDVRVCVCVYVFAWVFVGVFVQLASQGLTCTGHLQSGETLAESEGSHWTRAEGRYLRGPAGHAWCKRRHLEGGCRYQTCGCGGQSTKHLLSGPYRCQTQQLHTANAHSNCEGLATGVCVCVCMCICVCVCLCVCVCVLVWERRVWRCLRGVIVFFWDRRISKKKSKFWRHFHRL